jgi:hypothetical protein
VISWYWVRRLLDAHTAYRASSYHAPAGWRQCDQRLEPRALQFVREWAKLRQDEIMANWERARRNEPLHGIDPLS